MTPEFRPHYIAYFDVLGYKAYFEGGGDVERLFDSIMDLTEQVTEALFKRCARAPWNYSAQLL